MSQRRTRAMGQSPGGFRSLDMDAPTRKSRAAKVPSDTVEPASNAQRAKPATKPRAIAARKRKTAETVEEGPSAKRVRHEANLSPPSPLPSASNRRGYIFHLPESPVVPPEDIRLSNSGNPLDSRTPSSNTPKEPTKGRAQPSPRRSGLFEEEEKEEEKALSECSDEEWAQRVPLQMVTYQTGTFPKLNDYVVSWIPGAVAMFSVRGDEYTRQEVKPRRGSIHLPSPPHLPTSARPLTELDVIAAISASIDWFEQNPSAVPPTAAEMSSILDDFNEAKKAKIAGLHGSPPPATSPSLRRHLSPIAENNSRLNPSTEDGGKPSLGRTWADALTTSTIGSVLRTPVKWFSRQAARQTSSASELRPTAPAELPRRVRSKSSKTKNRKRKAVPTKVSTQEGGLSEAQPVSLPVSEGRADAHLPVHLRGVNFEDLPPVWQAKSAHLRPLDLAEDDHEEVVDLEKLGAVAEQNRRKWGLPAGEGAVEAAIRACYEGEEYDDAQPVGSKRKVVVRFSRRQPKVFRAKLAPSTFGVPLNINESSSEEEVDVEYDEDEPERLVRQSDHRAASPVKSCMKGSRHFGVKKARNDDGTVSVNWSGVPGSESFRFRPGEPPSVVRWTPPQRTGGNATLLGSQVDTNFRARPSTFIFTPPKEAAQLLDARDEYEEMHPLTSDDPEVQEELDMLFNLNQKKKREPNIFWDAAQRAQDKREARPEGREETQKEAQKENLEETRKEDQEKAQRALAEAQKDALEDPQNEAQEKAQTKALAETEEEEALERALREAPEGQEQGEAVVSEEPKQAAVEELAVLEEPERKVDGGVVWGNPILQETANDRLNKLREKAQPHKPAVPSSLHVTKTISPVHETLRWVGNVELDPEVIAALDAIPDSEIIAESFDHIPYIIDSIVAGVPTAAFEETD